MESLEFDLEGIVSSAPENSFEAEKKKHVAAAAAADMTVDEYIHSLGFCPKCGYAYEQRDFCTCAFR